MIFGFLPPSSNESFLNIGEAIEAILSPALVLPVNEIALISLCFTIASPQLFPVRCSMFITRSGNPASLHFLESYNAVIGVTSLGFAITQLPAASAGAIFHVNKYKGKFQGEIQPTIPIGCLNV